MSDPLPAIVKVEDALKGLLEGYFPLSGWSIISDQSNAIALDERTDKTILIYTVAYRFDVADDNSQTVHSATIEFEALSQAPAIGTINRANHSALAHIVGAIGQDRHLGGMLQDIQEVDVAPSGANGKDIGSASLQVAVTFYTPRGNHFTIAGMGGQTF